MGINPSTTVEQGSIPSVIYANHPLDKSTASIRLLQFLPSVNGMVSCNFQTFNLDDCPFYIALSYTWGERSPTSEIFLDGVSFSVRENLSNALRAILHRISTGELEVSLLLWVDDLCINQEDRQERSHQVNLMSCIYANAELVLIWLGEEAEDSHLVMEFLENIPDDPPHQRDEKTLLDFLNEQLSGQRVFNAILAFCNRSYWKRLWIQQEIVLASTILVLCGSTSYSREKIERLTSLRHKCREIESLSLSPAVWTMCRIEDWNNQEANANTLDNLLYLWPSIVSTECIDPLDRVFGLLGIVSQSPRGRLGIEVNYEKTRQKYTVMLGSTW
jgi:hypothetical protein